MAAVKKKVIQTQANKDFQSSPWFVNVWRPAMGWTYMAICLFDFILAPIGTSVLITFYKSTIPVWRSLTLENGGIVHLAFGAILGVSAWGRTRETVTNTEVGAPPEYYNRNYPPYRPMGREIDMPHGDNGYYTGFPGSRGRDVQIRSETTETTIKGK